MSRPLAGGAINAVRQVVTRYAPDPRGAAMEAALFRADLTTIDGADGYVYTGDKGSVEATFNGDYGHRVQGFTGAAALAINGTVRPSSVGSSPTALVSRMQDTASDPGLRIFAARAQRQGFLS